MTDRPTKRERRELARKSKLEAQKRKARARRRQRMISALIALGVIAVLAVVINAGRQGSQERQAKLVAAATAAGCTAVQSPEDELSPGTPHLDPGATLSYKTNPPASGNHYGASPVTGVFAERRPPEVWLHNLEHGHVGVLYKDTLPDEVRTGLEGFVRERNTLTFMNPEPALEEELVFNAWTKLLRCPKPTDAAKTVEAAKLFFDVHNGNGPEGKIPGIPNA